MRGRIEIGTSGLSPDGEHFLYSAHKYVNAVAQTQQWTVVSRTPYLKAFAYYPGRGAGGSTSRSGSANALAIRGAVGAGRVVHRRFAGPVRGPIGIRPSRPSRLGSPS